MSVSTIEVPLRQSQISVETARSDVANYQTKLEQAKNLLDLLVGKTVPAELLPKDTVKQITSQKVLAAGLPSDLLNNRPDIVSAEYQLSAAGANIGAAKAAMFPTISLTANAGFASYQLIDLFKSGSTIWQFAPSINLPIFDWGTRKTNVKISKVDQQLSLTTYEKAIQTAFREVNDVLKPALISMNVWRHNVVWYRQPTKTINYQLPVSEQELIIT